jgi:hypothetical protein
MKAWKSKKKKKKTQKKFTKQLKLYYLKNEKKNFNFFKKHKTF